jgi:DNA polymerase-1
LPDGQPVNAVYGFISLLFKALEIFKPDSLAVCFDLPQPTFRHAFFPDYKAHRPPSPEEFRSQLPLLKEAINKLGIYMLSLAGYEGDDLIGTVSFLAEAENYQTLIMTGDRDAFQLISDQKRHERFFGIYS